ncbi:MAG: GDP-mannose 4,6-dehydratase [Chloroflexi bacterium]|nr:GDP-mannose 4,6-dehydratase [Chloroflexota bacterium]MCI0581172.1 GDP-mannose 4,6-dehydratase [Chloroflexota bacterium]MCI0643459.1 GDP-mannose 4,6-dehydratase [Chloroflexota bacterium]MCI0727457.1 GDP-mannose 4,6-dehydratase [Chloroflexota bacterium]
MKIFITGGAGFIGCNSADYFLRQGHAVVIFDNLSRVGGRANLEWLHEQHGDHSFRFVAGDVRDYETLTSVVQGADVVLHLAGQVAVTTSVINPREDFEINALGTFNVLEAVRQHCPEAAVLYASTNKVYGGMESVRTVERETRYAYADFVHGIPENFPLDFHSPYGCSKGAADQYTIDYARIYGLKTLTLRQSSIFGRRQFGVEDQGWVAHFVIAAVKGWPITIYGDGKQVRDLLHVSDLIRAYELGIAQIEALKGQAFNLGGGPENTLSIWAEFGPILESLAGHPVAVTYNSDWRPGDQHVFVADICKAERKMGWRPRVAVQEGIRDLYEWVSSNPHLFSRQ